MMVVIFNTETDELLQTCSSCRGDVLPEEIAYKVLDARGLPRIDYTIRGITTGNYTTNEFKKYMYILNGGIFAKEHQQLLWDKFAITADGVDKTILANCIVDADVFINDISVGVVAADGIVEITSVIPSTLDIMIKKEYWLSQEVTINAA